MKIFIKFFCSVLITPVFIILLLSGSVKYFLLNYKFSINVFQKYNVYKDLQIQTEKYLMEKNATTFLFLTSTENIKDVTNKNIYLTTKFLNGNMNELTFYIPVDKIPRELLPRKLGTLNQFMSANELIQKFNISGVDMVIFNQFKMTGKIVNILFYTFLGLFLLLLVYSHSVMLILIGLFLIIQNYFIYNFDNFGNIILNITLTPLLIEISKIWMIVGAFLIILSITIILYQKFAKIKHG